MNYQVIILFAAYMAFIVVLGHYRPEGKHRKYLIRKGVHLVTGLVIFYLTFHISRQNLLILFIAGTLFSFATFFVKRLNYIHVTNAYSLGTLFYPLGILLSFLLLYEMPLYYFQASLLFLAVSDTAANLGGYLAYGNPRFAILTEKKTPFGILLFSVTAFLILLALMPGPETEIMPYMILAVVCAAHFEIISFRGSDNLAVPLGSALFFFLTHDRDLNALWITVLIAAMGLVSFVLNRAGILTRKGSILAYFLGIYLFGILGFQWAIPVVFFFVTSVIFTRLNGAVNRKVPDTNRRNFWQVSANIAAAIVFSMIYLITDDPLFVCLYTAAIAAVTADTWASEIGPVFHRKCFSLSGWKSVGSGASGGISVAGTLAAFTGAFLVTLLGWIALFPGTDLLMIFIIALAGFLASFIDSLLGAFVEPGLEKWSYFIKSKRAGAISPNDMVNLLASFTASVFFLLLDRFF